MVKKIKIKIQNKYIFKTPMNKFLYFFFKNTGKTTEPKPINLTWLSDLKYKFHTQNQKHCSLKIILEINVFIDNPIP